MVTIGLFDSGVGGLTVAREVRRQIPCANMEYYGDSSRVPYAARSCDEITVFSKQIVDFLATKGVDLVIIACNTATAAALSSVQGNYPFPVLGIIESGAEAALAVTRNKKIGVIATQFTIDNRAYERTIKTLDPEAEVIGQACPMFTTLIEAGKAESPEAAHYTAKYLSTYANTNIDTLVLGCTHYPIMLEHITKNINPKVEIVDPAVEAVRKAKTLLESKIHEPCNGVPRYCFYTSGEPELFQRLGSKVFGIPLGETTKVELE